MFETFGPYVSNIGALGLKPVYVDFSRVMFEMILFVWKFLNVRWTCLYPWIDGIN